MRILLHSASTCVFTPIVEFSYMLQVVYKVIYYLAKTDVLFSGWQHIITLSRVFLPI